jgi:hypothetical protein
LHKALLTWAAVPKELGKGTEKTIKFLNDGLSCVKKVKIVPSQAET